MTDARPPAVSRRGFLLAAAGTAVAAGTAGSAAAQQTHTVEMTDELTYEPQTVTVAVGDTVVWETVGQVGHTVTAYEAQLPPGADYFASGGFESEEAARSGYPDGDVPGGESYEHTFEVAGTYEYFCVPHEAAGMVGTVEVRGGDGGGDDGGGEDGGAADGPSTGQPLIPGGHPLTLAVVVGSALAALASVVYALTRGLTGPSD